MSADAPATGPLVSIHVAPVPEGSISVWVELHHSRLSPGHLKAAGDLLFDADKVVQTSASGEAAVAEAPDPLMSIHLALTADGRRDVWVELHQTRLGADARLLEDLGGLIVAVGKAAHTLMTVESQVAGQAGAAGAIPPTWPDGQHDDTETLNTGGSEGTMT